MNAIEPTPALSGPPQLRKNYLSALENLAQAVGAMAPSGGIALTIQLVFAHAGNGTWALFFITAIAYCLIALNLKEFATRTASAGGLYHYAEMGLGEVWGLLIGWCYVFGLIFSISSPCLAVVHYLLVFCHTAVGPILDTNGPYLFLGLSMLLAVGLSVRDMRLSTDLILTLECISIGLMLVLAGIFLLNRQGGFDLPQATLSGVTNGGLKLGSVYALFCLTGFESVTTLGGESKDALRNIPRALFACVIPMGLLYVFMSYVLVVCFRDSGVSLANYDAPFNVLATAAGVPKFAYLINAGVLLSFFACVLGCLNAVARVLYDMAGKSFFWPAAGVAHPRNATPHRAILLVAALVVAMPIVMMRCGLTLSECIDYMTQLGSFGFIVSYVGVCLAALFYLKRLRALKAHNIFYGVIAVVILCIPLLSTVYPLPDGPAKYFPYLFVLIVTTSTIISLAFRRMNSSNLKSA